MTSLKCMHVYVRAYLTDTSLNIYSAWYKANTVNSCTFVARHDGALAALDGNLQTLKND